MDQITRTLHIRLDLWGVLGLVVRVHRWIRRWMIGIVGAHPAGDGQLRGPKRSSISERPVSPDLGYVAMNEEIHNTTARPKTFTAQKQGLFDVPHN
jgi:hypothetical protein